MFSVGLTVLYSENSDRERSPGLLIWFAGSVITGT